MTDRAQEGHTGGESKQDYQSEAAYMLATMETQIILSRIKGLFPAEMCEWVSILPNDNRVISALVDRYQEMHMNSTEAEAWAEHLTEANTAVFESFVDKEESEQILTMMIEAEASRANPRPGRIGYINQRKQEL